MSRTFDEKCERMKFLFRIHSKYFEGVQNRKGQVILFSDLNVFLQCTDTAANYYQYIHYERIYLFSFYKHFLFC